MAYDYTSQLTKLNLSPLSEALNNRHVFQQQTAARQEEQRRYDAKMQESAEAQARQAQFNTDYQDAVLNPAAEKFTALRANYPDFHEVTESGWKTYSDAQQRDMTQTAGSIVAALANDRPELALHALEGRRAALADSKIDTTETDALIGMIKSGDPVQMKAARGISGMVLAQATGDRFDSVWQRLNKVQNDEEVQDDRQRSAAADADYKEARARLEPARVQATIGRANATASDTRSRQKRREQTPIRAARSGGASSTGGGAERRAAATKRTPTATGPDGRKYVVRNGQWVSILHGISEDAAIYTLWHVADPYDENLARASFREAMLVSASFFIQHSETLH